VIKTNRAGLAGRKCSTLQRQTARDEGLFWVGSHATSIPRDTIDAALARTIVRSVPDAHHRDYASIQGETQYAGIPCTLVRTTAATCGARTATRLTPFQAEER